jgi:predicted transport protein
MKIFKIQNKTFLPIKEIQIDLEKSIQSLVENNLFELFTLKFIVSEYPLHDFRVDTLAFDETTNSFVIIEYKKDKNISVIDQGYAYMALLLNNKADFVLIYNEKVQKNLKKTDIDWSQSRIIFISTSFTKYQQEAIGFQDLPMELWEVKKYENEIITFNEIHASKKDVSINVISGGGKNAEVVKKEIKVYKVEDLIKPHWKNTKYLFDQLSQKMMDMDPNFEVHPVKYYIGFNLDGKNVITVSPKTTKLTVDLLRVQPQDLHDPLQKSKYIKNSYKYYQQHISSIDIENEEAIEYSISLIKQVYEKFKH